MLSLSACRKARMSIIASTLLLPVKNGTNFIESAINNLVEIRRDEDEILIIDDGSGDDTLNKIRKLTSNVKNINLIRTNGVGLANALNLGFKESANKLIARCDVDDNYDPRRIQMQTDFIEDDTVVLFTDYNIMLNGTNYIGHIPSALTNSANLVSLVSSRQTAHPSALIIKSAWEEVGGYKQSEFPAEDLGLWYRLARLGKIKSLPETLLNYNFRTDNVSTKNYKQAKLMTKKFSSQFLDNHFSNMISLVELEETWKIYGTVAFGWERRYLLINNLRILNQINSKKYGILYKHLARKARKELIGIPKHLSFFYYAAQRRRIRR